MLKLMKKYWIGIVAFLIISIALPTLLWLFRIIYDKIINTYDVSWLGYFGSYMGGVLGGGATLIAVVYTIQNNKDEQTKKENKDKQVLIEKAALIVYYDFYFAFSNIKSFMNKLWNKSITRRQVESVISKEIDELGNYEIDYFRESCNQFDQFYFNSNWVSMVANLKDSSQINHDDIAKICEIYGYFMTIQKSLKESSIETCKNAYKAMNEIIDFKSAHKEGSTILFNEKSEVVYLLNKLEKIAFEKDACSE